MINSYKFRIITKVLFSFMSNYKYMENNNNKVMGNISPHKSKIFLIIQNIHHLLIQ